MALLLPPLPAGAPLPPLSMTGLGVRLIVPAVLFVLAVLALPVDMRLALYCRVDHYPRWIREILESAEPFGHAAGVGFIVISMAVLDPLRRNWAPWLCLCGAIAGGLAANIVKLSVGRIRPRNFDLTDGTVWDTFNGWFLFGSGGSASQSFPSAHTAVAMGFAVTLTAVYPHGRWLFFSMAGLVAMHRIESSAHYLSDVCAGGALGWIVGHLCIMGFVARQSAPASTGLPLNQDIPA